MAQYGLVWSNVAQDAPIWRNMAMFMRLLAAARPAQTLCYAMFNCFLAAARPAQTLCYAMLCYVQLLGGHFPWEAGWLPRLCFYKPNAAGW